MANCKFVRVSDEFAILLRCAVRDLAVLLVHVLATLARLAGPGGVRAVVAESLLVKQQLLIPQSLQEAVATSSSRGSSGRRRLRPAREPAPAGPRRHRPETFHAAPVVCRDSIDIAEATREISCAS
jgi:hypothetical protein